MFRSRYRRTMRLRPHSAPRQRAVVTAVPRPAGAGAEPLEPRLMLAATLLKDINTTESGGWFRPMGQVGDRLLIIHQDRTTGDEPWVSDGTPEGTRVLADVYPGPESSKPTLSPGGWRAFDLGDGTAVFAAKDGTGTKWWRTDGTPEGTNPYAGSAPGDIFPDQFAVIGGGTVYYTRTGAAGAELWRTDGTEAGTRRAVDLKGGHGITNPRKFTPVGDRIFFTADTTAAGNELWVTDGTAAGTRLVGDLFPGNVGSSPTDLTPVGDRVFFTSHGTLWVSDGTTEGTHQVGQVRPVMVGESQPHNEPGPRLAASGGRVFFAAAGAGGASDVELWVSDGTDDGTRLLKDVEPGAGGSGPARLTDWNGTLYFSAFTAANYRQLWRTDGTEAGTVMVRRIEARNRSDLSYGPFDLAVMGDRLYFCADDGTHGSELWRTDGTAEGTEMVRDIMRGPNGTRQPMDERAPDPHPVGSKLFFDADDASGIGRELWVSDGTADGTRLAANLDRRTVGGYYNPEFPFPMLDGAVTFLASDPGHGLELWRSDGTEAGTSRVSEFAGGSSSASSITSLGKFGGLGIIATTGNIGPIGTTLWRTDGTPGGTTQLGRFAHAYAGRGTAATSDALYFIASGSTDYGLWKSDGTPEGTVLVKSLPQAYEQILAVGDTVYFQVYASGGTLQTWKTDGTPGGTVLTDLPGDVRLTADIGGSLYFTWRGSTSGTAALWRSDGTMAGSTPLRDVPAALSDFTPTGDGGYFLGGDETGRYWSLWHTDGTRDGTRILRVFSGAVNSSFDRPSRLTNVDGRLFFVAPATANDFATTLWVSDGTAGGTVPVRRFDYGYGPINGIRTGWTAAGDVLVFPFNSPFGVELWRSDGTERGTYPLGDVYPGSASSSPVPLGRVGDSFVFAANDGQHGAEPWSVRLDDEPVRPRIDPVSPDPRWEPVSRVTITFAEPVSGFDLADLSLTRTAANGGPLGLSLAAAALTTADNTTFVLSGLTNVTRQPGTYTLTVRATGTGIATADDGEPALDGASESWQTRSEVVARHVFYNNSVYDGNNAAPNAGDDGAIATDKQVLRPGETATPANYTGYAKGVNGLMVDVGGLPLSVTLDASDFQFHVGSGGGGPDGATTWSPAMPPSVLFRRGAGRDGSDRVTLVWPDNQIRNQWLRVTVPAGGWIGLTTPDVFYFGNLVGDTMNSPGTFRVDSQDVSRTRNAQLRPADIASLYDHNRDGRINTSDQSITRNNQGFELARLTAAPVGGGAVSAAEKAALPVPAAGQTKRTAVRRAVEGLV